MTRKIIIASVALLFFGVLALNAIPYAKADDTTKQTIAANLDGFAFTNEGCCPDVSTSIQGELVTNQDGTVVISKQTGNIMLNSTTYSLEFDPTSEPSKETVSNDCSSTTTYKQDGEITLTGPGGMLIKGSGEYSWGTWPSCSGEQNSYTNFSGEITDSAGQRTQFFTGNNSLPTTQ